MNLLRTHPPLLRTNPWQQTCPSDRETISTNYAVCFADDGQVGEIRPDNLTVVEAFAWNIGGNRAPCVLADPIGKHSHENNQD